jgi:hypothetical protein
MGVHLDRPEPRPQRLRVHPQPASDASDRHTLRAQPGRRATMDLGSQVLNAARQCGRPPRWTSRCGSRSRRRERVELVYPGAVTGSAIWDLAAQRPHHAMDRGRLRGHRQLTFAVPHLDNRMIIIRSGQTTPRRKYSATRPTTLTSWRRLPSRCRTACRFGIDSMTRWTTRS